MIDELYVQNLGVIAEARLEPGPGLVALTGETGAGKTLVLGAIRLLRGETARTDRIGPHGDEARVEGRFSVGGEEIVAGRRVGGRSRAYLDGSMVPARALTERIDELVEIVGQHEHVSIGRDSSVRAMVDGMLDQAGVESRRAYGAAWEHLSALRAERDALVDDPRQLARDLDLARHQLEEIRGARLQPAEDEQLRDLLIRLRNSGRIAEILGRVGSLVEDDGGASDRAREALTLAREAAELDASVATSVASLQAAVAELDEAAAGVRRAADAVDHEPASLRDAEERAAVIADLKRKYGDTSDDVVAFGDQLEASIAVMEDAERRAEALVAALEAAEQAVAAAGDALREHRQRAARRLASAAIEILGHLGFSDPQVIVDVAAIDPGPQGSDRCRLLFASSDALTPGPAARVASGGELSRLVLALRVAAGVADADIVAFDEIDAGVGGSTALEMGKLLGALARGRQVLVVTHLPQIAAFADAHFVVDRSGTAATVRRVDGEERLTELARMLGGLGDSEQGRKHAAELIEVASGMSAA